MNASEIMIRSLLRSFGLEPALDKAVALAQDGTLDQFFEFVQGIKETNQLLREIRDELQKQQTIAIAHQPDIQSGTGPGIGHNSEQHGVAAE